MLEPYAAQFVLLAQTITELKQFEPTASTNALLSVADGAELDKMVRAYWPALKILIEAIPLPSVVSQMKRIESTLRGSHTQAEVIGLMADLYNRLEDELSSQYFFHVKPYRVAYYTEPMPFGDDVARAYPNARDDIEAAGKCLALEQGTATVFHLMCAMEIALKSLGKALGIDYAPSWDSYIRQITRSMETEHKKKPADWKKDESFYRDLLGDLVAVKSAWRNPTIHVRRKYLPDEAEEVFRAVRTFMKRAATKLSDPSAASAGSSPPISARSK